MNSRLKKTLTGVGLALSALLFSIGVLKLWTGIVLMNVEPFARESFDRAKWLAQDGSDEGKNPRGLMVYDLIDRHLQPGISMQEVLALLGEPDYGRVPNVRVPGSPVMLCYNLGRWRSLGIDPDSLDVWFDGEDRFVKTEIVQH